MATNTCALSAPLAGQASAAKLLTIRIKASTALPEIAAGKVNASAVIRRVIANSFLLPRLLPQESASKKLMRAALRAAAEGEG